MDILKKINWKVRFQNKVWVLGFVGALFVLAGAVLRLFGVSVDLSGIEQNVFAIVEALFGVLAFFGCVVDGTTNGFADSAKALTYDAPAPNITEEVIDSDDAIEHAIAIEELDDDDKDEE